MIFDFFYLIYIIYDTLTKGAAKWILNKMKYMVNKESHTLTHKTIINIEVNININIKKKIYI